MSTQSSNHASPKNNALPKNNAPVITLILIAFSSALMLLPKSLHNALYFNANAIETMQLWQLVSGHIIHADFKHLFWNMAGLLVLGHMIEQRARDLLVIGFVAGVFAVNILLLSPLSPLSRYCGLSGVLNTLLVCALWQVWRETRSYWVVFTAVLCATKILYEMTAEKAIFTSDLSWPPFPPAHLAGALGGLLALSIYLLWQSRRQS